MEDCAKGSIVINKVVFAKKESVVITSDTSRIYQEVSEHPTDHWRFGATRLADRE